MGYVGMGMSVGVLAGPLLGGVVFDRAGYNAVFGMAYALVLVDIILRLLLVEKKVALRWAPQVVEMHQTTAGEDASNENGMKRAAEKQRVVQESPIVQAR